MRQSARASGTWCEGVVWAWSTAVKLSVSVLAGRGRLGAAAGGHGQGQRGGLSEPQSTKQNNARVLPFFTFALPPLLPAECTPPLQLD